MAGNFTEPLLIMTSVLLTACVLSGEWWLLGYALLGVIVYIIVLLYALYLEYRSQTEVERRHRMRTMRPKPRREPFVSAASSDAGRSSNKSRF